MGSDLRGGMRRGRVVGALVLPVASPALGDSGRLNLHADVAGVVAGPPVAGGGGFQVGADFVLKPPIAIHVVLGAGGIALTDDLGTAEHNDRLSEARAQSVLEWLVSHGIARDRLTAKGCGASRPRTPSTDDRSRARNRRIEFHRIDE